METASTMTTTAVGDMPAAFVLSPIKSEDVWTMVGILKHIDIMGAVKSIDPELLKSMEYKAPTMMNGSEEIPLPEEKWTKAQKKARDKYEEARDALMWQVLGVLMNNIEYCKEDINKMLASGIGKDADFIRNMDGVDYLELIVQYITREEFADFFMRALGLLKRMGSSRSSIASAVMSTR